MLNYSIPIPKKYWTAVDQGGKVVMDSFKGHNLACYLPFGFTADKKYDIFYFKMGTNNKASQFWNWPGYVNNFNYVIDNLIANGEIKPCVIVVIDGEKPNQSWLPANAYDLICYVEGKVLSYANKDPNQIIPSAPHRAVGGWSLGSIECRTMLVNEKKNDYWKMFGWYDIQSGYNATNMDKISPIPFVGCAAGSVDDPNCVKFTKTCKKYFTQKQELLKNVAQIVPGYSHMITCQLNYFFNAIQFFFGPSTDN